MQTLTRSCSLDDTLPLNQWSQVDSSSQDLKVSQKETNLKLDATSCAMDSKAACRAMIFSCLATKIVLTLPTSRQHRQRHLP